jgi:hypothetical protein
MRRDCSRLDGTHHGYNVACECARGLMGHGLHDQVLDDPSRSALGRMPLAIPVDFDDRAAGAAADTGDHAVDDNIRAPGAVGLAFAGLAEIHRAVDRDRTPARLPLGGHCRRTSVGATPASPALRCTSATGRQNPLTPHLSVPPSRGRVDLHISTTLTARLDAIDQQPRLAPGSEGEPTRWV